MNKKISISIIPIMIIAIVVIIITAVLIKKDEASKLSKVYEKMMDSQTYAFTRYDLEEKHKIITYRKLNKTLIDMYNPEQHLSTLVIDGNTYLIFHENQEYYVYQNNTLDEEILTNNLKSIIEKEYTTGKEKIYGKAYNYEEYNGVSDFLISSSRNINLDTVKTRFYFKGNQLVYLKTIYEILDEETSEKTQVEELQTVKIEYQVEDNIFKIPAEYAEN